MANIEYLTKFVDRLESTVKNELKMQGNTRYDIFTVTEVASPPSRLARFDTFLTDTPRYLDSLIPSRSGINVNCLSVSTLTPNIWSFGKLVETNPPLDFQPYNLNPEALLKPSVKYVDELDLECAYYRQHSLKVNEVLNWISDSMTSRGEVDTWSGNDLKIEPLSQPMSRVMGEVEFNNTAIAFSRSMYTHTKSLSDAVTKINTWLNGSLILGGLSELVTEFIVGGNISDTVIEN